MPPIPTIWGVPQLYDHTSMRRVPLGHSEAGTNPALLFDGEPALQLLPASDCLTGHWLLTLDLPLLAPLADPLPLQGWLRYWAAQPVGGGVRIQLAAAGQVAEATLEAPEGTVDEHLLAWPPMTLPAGTTGLAVRLEVWLRRVDREQVAVQLISLDLSGPLPPPPAA